VCSNICLTDAPQLDARLGLIAEWVRKGVRVADIGADHGFLSAVLALGGAAHVYACDIRPGPLQKAAQTVEKYACADRVSLHLADGLEAISAGMADDIVIAGMGGEVIAGILQRAPWLADARYRLLLQPMSKEEALRRWLAENGFAVEKEACVTAAGRSYAVIKAAYCGKKRTLSVVEAEVGSLTGSDEAAVYYLKKRADYLHSCAEGARKAGRTAEAEVLQAAAEEILLRAGKGESS